MLHELKELRLRQLDELLQPWMVPRNPKGPRGGWIRAIREGLGMTAAQLGRRMGVSRQGIADLEKREAAGAVTLGMLRRAADALNADVVYAIVPRATLREQRERQARFTVEQELQRVAHTMRLEAQEVSAEELEYQVRERAGRLVREWKRGMWDDVPGDRRGV